MNTLNIDEVMALQMLGLPVRRILNTDLIAFDKLYYEHPELEEYIDRANEIIDRQESINIFTLSCHDPDFPKSLLSIGSDCPPLIYCKGNLKILNGNKAVTIIGARKADREGNTMAYQLGKQYAEAGRVVVSGLAAGCDTSAHQGCIDVGGHTIAIVGNGLDLVHPKENKQLAESILDKGGLLISEQIMGVKANPSRLVARNRLQAALAEEVILVQCPAKSGSLYTMKFARKYGRRCYAVTFPRRNDANAGNYMLLESGEAQPI